MKNNYGTGFSLISGYWKVLRIVIVIFFLFLIGDAFFRWDGFKYYATFSEFVPSLALITVCWAILAVCTALLIWGILITLQWLGRRIGTKISIDHFMMVIVFFILFGATAWKCKQIISSHYAITDQLRLIVLIIVTLTAFGLTYILRNKATKWMRAFDESITPLVGLFVIVIIISPPIVIYHTWIKQPERSLSQKVEGPIKESAGRSNIILVIFDALTARDMTGYGYYRATTPFIDTWAKEASVFKRVKAASNVTTPTTASLMTGKRLWTHQTFHLKGSKPVRSTEENLPLLLKNNGYFTTAFIANGYASVHVLGIENSFDIAPMYSQFLRSSSLFGIVEKRFHYLFGNKIKLHDWLLQDDFIFNRILMKFCRDENITNTPPEKVFRRFLWSIDHTSSKPFFAWIHLYPPHYPYIPPKPFKNMFNVSPMLSTSKTQDKAKELGLKYKYTFREFPPEVRPTMAVFRDRYDEFIRYCDSQFENFIASLSKSNKLENTIIILSSDHGESFEHGSIHHSGLHLYEQVTHIPLMIKEPGQKEGLIINDLAEQIDIPATILDLANIQIPPWMEGRSLLPLMRGKSLPEQPVFSMDMAANPSHGEQITKGTIAVWEDDYKLIHYIEKNKNMLFNIKRDPDEFINLFDINPRRGRRMLGIINDNLHSANERIKREHAQ